MDTRVSKGDTIARMMTGLAEMTLLVLWAAECLKKYPEGRNVPRVTVTLGPRVRVYPEKGVVPYFWYRYLLDLGCLVAMPYA